MEDGGNQNVDLSRNFPDQFHAANFVRPETKAVMSWIKVNSFVLSASILGGTLDCVLNLNRILRLAVLSLCVSRSDRSDVSRFG